MEYNLYLKYKWVFKRVVETSFSNDQPASQSSQTASAVNSSL